MAKDKKSFILYSDLKPTIDLLPDIQAGMLFKTILSYVNDENPDPDDLIVKISFQPIKAQLKRDLRKWERYIQKQKDNGKMGGRPKTQNNPEKGLGYLANPTEPKKADSVNVSVSVNDNVTENVIDIENILSEHEIGKTIEFCSITLQREYSNARVGELWKAFLINGQKKYHSLPEKIKHFRNWLKTQPHETDRRNNTACAKKLGTSDARIQALKSWPFGESSQ
jgi:hypothetical protein